VEVIIQHIQYLNRAKGKSDNKKNLHQKVFSLYIDIDTKDFIKFVKCLTSVPLDLFDFQLESTTENKTIVYDFEQLFILYNVWWT
jgi:hypothetical protein